MANSQNWPSVPLSCVCCGAHVRQWGKGYQAARGAAAMAIALLGPDPVRAESWLTAVFPALPHPTQELSGGADATAHSWTAYTGITSTFGSDIRQDGWRFRAVSGYGQYSYTSRQWNGRTIITIPFDGTTVFADIVLGYQHKFGPLTVKAFAGATAQNQSVTPFDIESQLQGWSWGAKGALETWLDIGDTAFAQLDIAMTTAHDSYNGRLRVGYRILPQLSVGLEAGLMGNVEYEAGRLGAFIRYEAGFGEVSLSGGAAGDRSDITGAYGTINALYRF